MGLIEYLISELISIRKSSNSAFDFLDFFFSFLSKGDRETFIPFQYPLIIRSFHKYPQPLRVEKAHFLQFF